MPLVKEQLGPIHFSLVHTFGSMFSGILSMCGCNHQSPCTPKAKPRAAAFSRWISFILETVVKVRATKNTVPLTDQNPFHEGPSRNRVLWWYPLFPVTERRRQLLYSSIDGINCTWWFCTFAMISYIYYCFSYALTVCLAV